MLHKPRQIASSSHISLDLIQYFSCLIVFAGHFCQIFLYRIWGLNNTVNNVQHPFICALSHAATFAVMVFFVLSGLLVAYSTINDTEKHGCFDLSLYLKKRIFRIIPPLYGAILLTVIIYALIKTFHLFGYVSYQLPNDFILLETMPH